MEIDGATWLLLEEAPGVRLCDADPHAYLLAVRALAQLHADGSRPGGLPELVPAISSLSFEALHATYARIGDGLYHSVNRRSLETVEQRIRQRWPAMVDAISHWPAGLLHGDAHAGNLFVTPGGKVSLIDWSSAAIGPGLLDIAALVDVAERMATPLPPPDRLLSAYWGALPPAMRSAYGDPERAWAITRVVRALMELQWFAATGADYGTRVNREAAIMERYLPLT